MKIQRALVVAGCVLCVSSLPASAQRLGQTPHPELRLKLPSAGRVSSVPARPTDPRFFDSYAKRWAPAPPAQSNSRGVGRRILGGAVGAAGGLFAGGYIGAKIEGDRCHCDDPGLTGALIGAPIGAVLGGIAGALWLF